MSTFKAENIKTLKLGLMYGHVRIFLENRKDIEIEVTGDSQLSGKVDFKTKFGTTLEISCELPTLGKMPGISAGIMGGNMILNGIIVDKNRPIIMVIRAPNGTAIEVIKLAGSLKVEDTSGDVILHNDTLVDIQLGVIGGNAKLITTSIGGASIKEALGRVTIHISGTGSTTIEKGHTQKVEVTCTSIGGFKHGGKVTEASLLVNGTGNVNIEETTGGNITAELTSIGKVTIKQGLCDFLSVKVSGMGDFNFSKGHSKNAKLVKTSMGSIKAGFIVNKPQIVDRGMGRISYS